MSAFWPGSAEPFICQSATESPSETPFESTDGSCSIGSTTAGPLTRPAPLLALLAQSLAVLAGKSPSTSKPPMSFVLDSFAANAAGGAARLAYWNSSEHRMTAAQRSARLFLAVPPSEYRTPRDFIP